MSLRIGMLVGEKSGDILGAGLLRALKKKYPTLSAVGIAGPLMQAEGCRSLYDMERLSVMGFVEPLSRLPELIRMRKALIQFFIKDKPDIFIGIDAPAFNTGLECALKKAGIPVVHYVGPSVWAWRKRRIFKIKKAVDKILVLFPFEKEIYAQHQIPHAFVGHPLADAIPLNVDMNDYRRALDLPLDQKILALLPGSRRSEVHYLGEAFLETARRCVYKYPHLQIVAPMANEKLHVMFQAMIDQVAPELPIRLIQGHSREVMAASDVVLLASGTATLEALLLAKPMVVAYRLSRLNFYIAKCLVKTPFFALPNILAQKKLVPEFLQQDVQAECLTKAVLHYFECPQDVALLKEEYAVIHQILRQNADEKAASAVISLLEDSVHD